MRAKWTVSASEGYERNGLGMESVKATFDETVGC